MIQRYLIPAQPVYRFSMEEKTVQIVVQQFTFFYFDISKLLLKTMNFLTFFFFSSLIQIKPHTLKFRRKVMSIACKYHRLFKKAKKFSLW